MWEREGGGGEGGRKEEMEGQGMEGLSGGGGKERRDSVKEGSGEKGCVHDNSAS